MFLAFMFAVCRRPSVCRQ